MRKLVLLPVLALVACGPMSPELAAKECEDRARAAANPVSGTAAVGISNNGIVTDLDVGISVSNNTGRDPYIVYDQCVRQLSGQGPIRPLIL